MVRVFLRGGLGNQMFQYAAGLALAKKNNEEIVLDTVFLNDRFPRKEFSYRTFDLDIFTLAPHLTALSRISSSVPIPGVWLGMDLTMMKLRDILHTEKIIKENKEQSLDPRLLEARGDVALWGRWQNAKYFGSAENEVRDTFAFRHPLEGEASEIAKQIRSSESVSLHVRRGDFGALKNVTALMGETNMDYYAAATKYISQKISSPTFFIFSDDIEWCKKNLKLDLPTVYVPAAAAGPKAAFHLELMSLCKHNIIANSTFSWWGAWLNANPNKMIIAPKQWYAADAKEGSEIVPEGWIKL